MYGDRCKYSLFLKKGFLMADMVCEVNEYDCWLQKRRAAVLPEIAEALERIVLRAGGETAEQAAEELRRGVKNILGFSPGIWAAGTGGPSGPEPGKKQTLAGLIGRLNGEFGLSLPAQKTEGFIIKAGREGILIAGQDEQGLLYGVFRFIMLLAQGKITLDFECSEAPAAPIRMINHWDNLDGSIERGYAGPSIFYKNNRLDYDPERIRAYARLLASVGINRISINNVNVRGAAKLLITEDYLPDLRKLAALFRPFGIRLFLCINFGAPYSLGGLPTADPLDSGVLAWWKERAGIIYRSIPDLAGFLVKADSEGEPGPFKYGRSHAEGANMLADALAPYGGEVIWRCFVYNCVQDWRDTVTDRARAAYDHFKPLDGSFAENVILQIKFGPYDFQVREPVSPLFGALTKTRHILELQITQEYTGHQIDLCFLPWVWADIMDFDTAHGEAAKMKELLGTSIEGMAAVSNVGLDANWTGHTLAQANLYGYGRIAWNPRLSAGEIAREWAALTFGGSPVSQKVETLLLDSYPVYEKYNAPFGICFMVTPGLHYGPSIEGYEFSKWGTYHRADREALGINRGPGGTGYTEQYAEKNARLFADPVACPDNLLLFFHRLPYSFLMKNGETLLQNIYDTHFEGYEDVKNMLETWRSLKNRLSSGVYESVLERFERHLVNAREWRDVVNTYFWRKTGIPDQRGRKIYG
jgi:alpha-glucuronidase